MTTDAIPSRNRAPSFIHALNPLMGRLLRIGAPMGPNVLLTVRGRTSGQPRSFPVAILETNGLRYVFCPFGDVNWVRNLRANGDATPTIKSRTEAVTAVELTPEQGAEVMKSAFAPFLASRISRFFFRRFYDLNPKSTPAEYLAMARTHPGFELRPAS